MMELKNKKLEDLASWELDELYDELQKLTYRDCSYYRPHKKQSQFHLSGKKGRVVLGGNRGGKSQSGIMEALFHSTGKYPKWFPQNLKMKQPTTGRIVVSDFGKGFGEVLQPKFDMWLPGSMIRNIKRNHEGWPDKYTLNNGSEFDICTHQQEKDVFEGWSGDWAWFDEPPPRYAFIGTKRGLIDTNGRYWMTMTPLSEAWIYDELVLPSERDIETFYFDIYDNPFLKKESIEEFALSLTDEEKEARLHGRFLHLSGLVYKNIDPKVHYETLDLEQKNSYGSKLRKQWYFVLDPHDRRPHCGIWAFADPMNRIHIAYELNQEGTITELSAFIRVFERNHGIENPIRIGDPNKMETPTAVTGLKLKQEFAKYGLYFDTKVDDNITRGHLAVKEMLGYDRTKPVDGLNSPRLYFSENVPKTKEMFGKYIYQEWRGALRDSKNPRETPKDLNKDYPDCTRYLVMKRPTYMDSSDSFNNFRPSFTSSRTGYH